MKWGILCALPQELVTLGVAIPATPAVVRLPDGKLAIAAGMGQARARRAAEALFKSGAQALMSWGTCAALDERIASGDLLVSEAFEGHPCTLAASLHAAVGASRQALFAHSARPLLTAGEKSALARSGAQAADMESLALIEVAKTHDLPWLVVRAVADDAQSTLPSYLAKTENKHGYISLSRLLLQTAIQPEQWMRFTRMCRDGQAALTTLRQSWPAAQAALDSITQSRRD